MTSITTSAREAADELRETAVRLRRQLHAYPELAFEEHRTAEAVAAQMRSLGLTVIEGIGGTGVVGLLDGTSPGQTVLIRAEMDGLDMDEPEWREYGSKLPNRNHACGHDVAMAVALTTAELLSTRREAFRGRVAFVFQPADEPMRGTLRMIEDGLLDIARPDYVLGTHVLPAIKVGQAVIQTGPLWASRDELTIRLTQPVAEQGDQTPPSLTLVAAKLVTGLQALADRLGEGRELVSFSVASLEADTTQRHAAGGAEIVLRFACHDVDLRNALLQGIEETVSQLAEPAGARHVIEADYAIPVLHNDAAVTDIVRRTAETVLGGANIVEGWRNPFADDVAFLTTLAAGCYFLLGTANPDKGITASWHTPEFDIDEDALLHGVKIMASSVLELLQGA